MEFKGKLSNVVKDWKSGKYNVSFEVTEGNIEEVNEIQDKDLLVTAKKYHKKRSLNANEYMWVLCTKIATVLNTSKDEVYKGMLDRYGVLYQDDSGYITVTVKANVDMDKIEGHWKYYAGDGRFKSYLMIKGTSQYDTAEMSRFVDCVVSEAKELGIETLTPNEIERMKQQWKA